MNFPIEVGEKLEIIHYSRTGDEEHLASQLLEVKKNGLMDIAMPIKEGRLIPLHVNNVIKVLFFRENGQFHFKAKVIEQVKKKIPVLRIKMISKISKIQRRGYYRLNTVIPLKIQYRDPVDSEELEKLETFTLDISGGGLKFVSSDMIDKELELICELDLDDKIYILKARAVRSNHVYHTEYAYEISVEFTDIDKLTRGEIIKFVLDKQMKMKRKGMI